MNAPSGYVVDASLGVKWFVNEEDSDLAISLVADQSLALHVPDLFFVECANVLWKKVRKGHYSSGDAAGDLADLRAMELTVASTADLVESAFAIALAHSISAYDACYVALAESLAIPLITADERLAASLAGTSHEVICLKAVRIPGETP